MPGYRLLYHPLVPARDIPRLDPPTRRRIRAAIERKLVLHPEAAAKPLAHTTQPWVLNVDADERVTPELRDEILELLRDPPKRVSGYYARRLVYYLGLWWHRGPFYPGYRLRLVRRSRASWGGTDPHDLAMVRGRTRRLKAPLLHYTYNDISDHIETVNRLTDVAARSRRSTPGLLSLMLRPTWRFAWTYTFTGGFREGFRGLFVCMTAAFYVFLRLAKRVERTVGGRDSEGVYSRKGGSGELSRSERR